MLWPETLTERQFHQIPSRPLRDPVTSWVPLAPTALMKYPAVTVLVSHLSVLQSPPLEALGQL